MHLADYDDRLVVIARRPAMTMPVVLSLFLVTAIVPMPAGLRSVTVSVLATILLFSFLLLLLFFLLLQHFLQQFIIVAGVLIGRIIFKCLFVDLL